MKNSKILASFIIAGVLSVSGSAFASEVKEVKSSSLIGDIIRVILHEEHKPEQREVLKPAPKPQPPVKYQAKKVPVKPQPKPDKQAKVKDIRKPGSKGKV